MFNAIRSWFLSKQYELSAWVRRPRKVDTAIRQVITGMEELGIKVVDASAYPKSVKGEVVGAVVIVAGYIPRKPSSSQSLSTTERPTTTSSPFMARLLKVSGVCVAVTDGVFRGLNEILRAVRVAVQTTPLTSTPTRSATARRGRPRRRRLPTGWPSSRSFSTNTVLWCGRVLIPMFIFGSSRYTRTNSRL